MNINPEALFAICIVSLPVVALGLAVVYHAYRQWKGDDR